VINKSRIIAFICQAIWWNQKMGNKVNSTIDMPI
jgi:hypothetical protein